MSEQQGRRVIPFPGLKDRLVERGLDMLQNQENVEAISLLEQALEMDQEDAAAGTSLAVAYYENNQWSESADLCKKMLQQGSGEYDELIELYVMNLIQLRKFNEISSFIEPLLEEHELQPEKAARLKSLIDLSQEQKEVKEAEDESFESFQLQKDLEQQMIQSAALSKQNIRPMKDDIISEIETEQTHPFIKTMLLNILREQGITDEVVVTKWGTQISVNPSELVEPFDQDLFQKAAVIIGEENNQPQLAEIAAELLQKHVFLLYPFTWRSGSHDLIADAYLRLAKEYMGIENAFEDFEHQDFLEEIRSLEKVDMG
ncbi:tetratricopeptide repeat protein [Jeotgalibacillus salarius]|uniref:Tetratricopeptide repeat protein n=1 Tax=Jeotgalibacillus salarius TaxID=546023 RepID=A0A4Y8LIU0_9BACL|nr:tetratricopeptide repeat protein [Jeotgalibacillus salarius]TFE00992.1 tetratricopeptide repeat protein [Jeotgalibacillus salarius]